MRPGLPRERRVPLTAPVLPRKPCAGSQLLVVLLSALFRTPGELPCVLGAMQPHVHCETEEH